MLIPYYYSDFLILCKSSTYISFFLKRFKDNNKKKKLFVFSFHKSIYFGKLSLNHRYTEQFLWSTFLYSYLNFKELNKPLAKLNFVDYLKSISLIKKYFLFVNRTFIYDKSSKFINNNFINQLFFRKNLLNKSNLFFIILYFYHIYRYIKLSILHFIKYVFKI